MTDTDHGGDNNSQSRDQEVRRRTSFPDNVFLTMAYCRVAVEVYPIYTILVVEYGVGLSAIFIIVDGKFCLGTAMTSYGRVTSSVTRPFDSAWTISYASSIEIEPVTRLVFMTSSLLSMIHPSIHKIYFRQQGP